MSLLFLRWHPLDKVSGLLRGRSWPVLLCRSRQRGWRQSHLAAFWMGNHHPGSHRNKDHKHSLQPSGPRLCLALLGAEQGWVWAVLSRDPPGEHELLRRWFLTQPGRMQAALRHCTILGTRAWKESNTQTPNQSHHQRLCGCSCKQAYSQSFGDRQIAAVCASRNLSKQ